MEGRILSLDGGGVRGISSLYILKELMAQVSRQRSHDHPTEPRAIVRPCDVFDLICGTSTGGLIALMLGRLEMVCSPRETQLILRALMILSKHTKHSLRRSSHQNRKGPQQSSITIPLSSKSRQSSLVEALILRLPSPKRILMPVKPSLLQQASGRSEPQS